MREMAGRTAQRGRIRACCARALQEGGAALAGAPQFYAFSEGQGLSEVDRMQICLLLQCTNLGALLRTRSNSVSDYRAALSLAVRNADLQPGRAAWLIGCMTEALGVRMQLNGGPYRRSVPTVPSEEERALIETMRQQADADKSFRREDSYQPFLAQDYGWAHYAAGLASCNTAPAAAAEELARAVSQGYSPAARVLGKMYFAGSGVPRNWQKAWELLTAPGVTPDPTAAADLSTLLRSREPLFARNREETLLTTLALAVLLVMAALGPRTLWELPILAAAGAACACSWTRLWHKLQLSVLPLALTVSAWIAQAALLAVR